MDSVDTYSFLQKYWGKARPSGAEGAQWHLLHYHCLDVAAIATVWWSLNPVLRQRFSVVTGLETGDERLRAWVLFFIALHDLGKLDIRFQKKAPEVLAQLQPEWTSDDLPLDGECIGFDHGIYGCWWFYAEYPVLLDLQERSDDVLETWWPWLTAVVGHHGRIPRQRKGADDPGAEEDVCRQDQRARVEFLSLLEELFLKPAGLCLRDLPPPLDIDGRTLMAGFCSICDWLGSNEQWFDYCADFKIDPVAYFNDRVAYARQEGLVRKAGLQAEANGYAGVRMLLGEGENPRQLQTVVDRLPLKPGLTLIEAPTGSGKTETALAYAWRLLDAGLADSIVFALPTQATANAMWERLERLADKLFRPGASLLVAHGKARWHKGQQSLREVARQHSVQGTEDIRVQCAEWLAESRKRVFLAQIGVCTIDQVLLSVLPVRHRFVRGFGVQKSVLIIDEVHAYDNYMYGLLDGVLRQQCRVGGSAILLSATLPHGQRRKLAEAWQAQSKPEAQAAYPLLTHIDREGAVSSITLDDPQRPLPRSVAIECVPSADFYPDPHLQQRIIDAAQGGARVAVICNLVDVAQRLARELREKTNMPVDLFHARFRFTDRQTREQQVLDHYGRHAKRDRGRILVATQVVEQSLDLDLDWLITQICPVDLLFQRLGRLHRHVRPRPEGFENPLCTILTASGTNYDLHKVIYGNTRVLWRTQRLLESSATIEFPGAYREWIERVYERADWEQEPEQIAYEYDKFHMVENDKFALAQRLANEDMNPFADTDENVQALTRDGEMSLSLALIDEKGCLLGDAEPVQELEEWVRRERLALAMIGVPHGWKKYLSTDDEGVAWLRMDSRNGIWIGESKACLFSYSEEYGLERKVES